MEDQLRQRLSDLVASDQVVLFMKGNRQAPQCGFSAQVVQILDRLLPEYTTVDVLQDPELREGVKELSDWPTIPQLYVRGEFQGGCDIVREMYQAGELHYALGLERSEAVVPEVRMTPAAAELVREAQSRHGGGELHLSIDALFRHSLGFGPASGDEVQVEVEGVSVLLDPDSSVRAHGLMIDVQEGPHGRGLRIDNPNSPPPVGQMSVQELAALRERGEPLRLIDVRTPEERERAALEGSELFDAALERELVELDKDTRLVFLCHHGNRSQIAAQRFAARGFRNLHNVAGGLEAWSREIDPSVPRY
ncbi:MAG TPA: Grx4 family monothiol glutaredoxin [Thermoanaerobaculia bacterium]|nr:Grx4 family monothiol glutaredoxin [Thermoanaerobaculia bacterium]